MQYRLEGKNAAGQWTTDTLTPNAREAVFDSLEEAEESREAMAAEYGADSVRLVRHDSLVAVARLQGATMGPAAKFYTTDADAEHDARQWAGGETGHPWDAITVCLYETDEDVDAGADPVRVIEIDLAD